MRTPGTGTWLAAIRRGLRTAVSQARRSNPFHRARVAGGIRFTLLLAIMSALEGQSATPPNPPVILHNLTEAQVSVDGPLSGPIEQLTQRFRLEPLRFPPQPESLLQGRLVWLVFPGQPRHAPEDSRDAPSVATTLLGHVEAGGSLLLLTQRNPGEPGSAIAKALMARLGITQGNRRTGAKELKVPASHPVIGGLVWRTGGITPLDMEESAVLKKPVLLPNDLTQRPFAAADPDYAGLTMIWGEVGLGRIVIVGDTDWLAKSFWTPPPATSKAVGTNALIFQRLVEWVAGGNSTPP